MNFKTSFDPKTGQFSLTGTITDQRGVIPPAAEKGRNKGKPKNYAVLAAIQGETGYGTVDTGQKTVDGRPIHMSFFLSTPLERVATQAPARNDPLAGVRGTLAR